MSMTRLMLAGLPRAFVRLTFAALCAVPAIGHAQLGDAPMPQISPAGREKPSLEATQKWITDKYREIGIFKPYSSFRRAEVVFDGCKFSVLNIRAGGQYTSMNASGTITSITGVSPGDGGAGWEADIRTGSLSDLVMTRALGFRTIGDRQVFIYNFSYSLPPVNMAISALNGDISALQSIARLTMGSDRKQNVAVFSVEAPDDAMEARFEAAFLHAADLCRAKDAAARQAEIAKSAKRPDEAF